MQRKTAFPRISPTAIPRPLHLYQLSFATFDGHREPAGAFASLPLPSAFSDPFRPVDKSGGLRYDIAKIYQIQKEVLSMLPWNRGVPMGRAVTTPPTSLPQQERIILPLPRGETPLVRVGDPVSRGQRVADGNGDPLPIYAPVSGTVAALDTMELAAGGSCLALILQNDGLDTAADPLELPDDEDALWDSGVRLPGGRPLAQAVTQAAPGLDTLILSAMDREPWHCTEDAALCLDADAVGAGLAFLNRLLHPRRTLLAVGAGQHQAAHAAAPLDCTVMTVPQRYPLSHPQLLAESLGRLPPGQPPQEGDVLVLPVSAVAAFGAALQGTPPIRQRVSVAWKRGHALIDAPMGAPLSAILEAAAAPDGPLLLGGPMTGSPLRHADGPLVPGITSLCVLPPRRHRNGTPCIRCGRCAAVCPMDRQPWLGIGHCLHCGACRYVCPAAGYTPSKEEVLL